MRLYPPQSSPTPPSADKLETKIGRLMGNAVGAYNLIEEGDRIMVGISGGKDSYTLLHMLIRMRRVAPIDFELVPFHLEQGQPGFQHERVRAHLESVGLPFHIHHEDTYSIVVDKLKPGQTTCSLCSRLRRGILYKHAVELGCTKIALGHHRDDAIETLLLNIFYSGQIKAMPPKLVSDDRRNTVIRPMITVPEKHIVAFSQAMAFPIVPCTLCSRQPNLKRDAMTRLLDSLEADNPNVRGNLAAALGNVVPSHLHDLGLFDPDQSDADHDAFLEALSL